MNASKGTFADSPPEVRALVEDRPPFWEHLLTAALLDEALMKARNELSLLQEGIEPLTMVYEADLEALVRRVLTMVESFKVVVGSVDPVLKRIMAAWGPPGTPGDPALIQEACSLFKRTVDGAVGWYRAYKSLRYPDEYASVVSPIQDLVPSFIEAIGVLPARLRGAVDASQHDAANRGLTIEINYTPKVRGGDLRSIDKVIRSYKRRVTGRRRWFGD